MSWYLLQGSLADLAGFVGIFLGVFWHAGCSAKLLFVCKVNVRYLSPILGFLLFNISVGRNGLCFFAFRWRIGN